MHSCRRRMCSARPWRTLPGSRGLVTVYRYARRVVTQTDLLLRDGRTLHGYDALADGAEGRLAVFWHHGTPNPGAPPEPLLPAAAERGHPLGSDGAQLARRVAGAPDPFGGAGCGSAPVRADPRNGQVIPLMYTSEGFLRSSPLPAARAANGVQNPSGKSALHPAAARRSLFADTEEVTGSNPVAPTSHQRRSGQALGSGRTRWASATVGSLQPAGRRGLQQTRGDNGCWPRRQPTAPARSSIHDVHHAQTGRRARRHLQHDRMDRGPRGPRVPMPVLRRPGRGLQAPRPGLGLVGQAAVVVPAL
jgi:hypothetical protein